MSDLLSSVSMRRGHFLLESGYHTDLWLTLDALFVDPRAVAPVVDTLAARLRPYDVSGICGPLLGGAFLAQALASVLGIHFYCAEPQPGKLAGNGLFQAEYRLPEGQRKRVAGEKLAVVDEVISAGSSVRATVAALDAAGAETKVVGSFLILGDVATTHFSGRGIPLVALASRSFPLWQPAECPLCRSGTPLETPP